MCGIAGALVLDGTPSTIDEDYLVRMRETLVHRGPDGSGLWLGEGGRVGLAARRLAIVDLSERANQPMANEDGTVRLVCNGEIYNHAELRSELVRLGHRFRTDHSDTEVVVHAFEEWGIDCLHRFRGMFAIAIWDARSSELWLVRDRIGIKPLYYALHHGRLVFASEIKALLADPGLPRAVDEVALYHYLSFLTTPAPQTLFAGVSKLPAGTWLRIAPDGSRREERYWDALDHVERLVGADDDEIAERVLTALRDSVRLRKVSDVPVGVFLSGGLDSSTNAALFAEDEPAPINTFCVGYDRDYGSYPNEFEWARAAARFVGSEHRERVLSLDDTLDILPMLVRHQDEPIGDPVCVPLYYLARLARDSGVTVCQLGEGADELFCGYPSWLTYLRLQRLAALPGARSLAVVAAGAGAVRAGRGGELVRRAGERLPVFWSGADAFADAEKRRLLAPRLRRELETVTSWDALADTRSRFEERARDPAPLHWMTYADLSLRLPELLLMRVDKMTMAAGVEARVPFLDHELVSLALAIPQRTLTRHGELKSVLRRAVRGRVPAEVMDRPKQGFGIPLREWVRGALGVRAREELRRFCADSELLDADAALAVVDSGRGREAWYLLNLALWWQEYLA